jgi:hypothetical protein
MATMHHFPTPGVTPFAIYEDLEEQTLMSAPDMFEGNMSFDSELSLPTPDEAIPSIELDNELEDEPQPYRSSYTSRKATSQPRRSSGVTHYSIVSAIPSEISISSKPTPPVAEVEMGYTPRKERPRFRNPESVRAMQMSSPPLLPTYEPSREHLKGSYKLMTPSKSGRSETPMSKKTGSRRGSAREHHSPMPVLTPQQAPLVLLHVTILPPQVPYSHDLMVRIMPDWLVENYKLLDEKLQDIILMRRGVLIPHPRDEYELLEERILESLELKVPRLLKCGHFVAPEDDTDIEDDDEHTSATDDSSGRGSRMSGGTITEEHDWKEDLADGEDASICTDCHHEVKKPRKGVGAGSRRWDIKVYAANGLMRAAAWTACYNEMERCDVEISPWIPDELRKTLDRRVLEEQEAEKRKQMYAVELQRQIQEATSKQKIEEEEAAERKRLEEVELQKSFEAAAAALERSVEEKAAEKKRFEEAVEKKIEEAKEAVRLEVDAQAAAQASALAERLRALEHALEKQMKIDTPQASPQPTSIAVEAEVRRSSRSPSGPRPSVEIPLGTLLKNYILVLLRDQRNIIILVLSALVVGLVMTTNAAPKTQTVLPPHTVGMSVSNGLLDPVYTVAITTTETAFSTVVITRTKTAYNTQQTSVPVPNSAHIAKDASKGEAALAEDILSPLARADDNAGAADASLNEEAPLAPSTFEQIRETLELPEVSTVFETFATTVSGLFEATDATANVTHKMCSVENVFETSSQMCPK